MSSSDMNGAIRLGALGWFNPAWRETFYPADMPDEWQLTYFNTQFNCVFLEHAVWQQARPEQLTQWQADTHEQFRFLLESEDSLPIPAELAGKAVSMRRDDPSLLWFSRDSSLKELAASLAEKPASGPRYLISLDGDLGQIDRVATLLEVMGL